MRPHHVMSSSSTGSIVTRMGIIGVTIFLIVGIFAFSVVTMSRVIAFTNRADPFVTPSRNLPLPSCAQPGVEDRRRVAYYKREAAALREYELPIQCHVNNGDEDLYSSTHIGSFSKGLQHDALGQPTPSSYASFLNAIRSGVPADFEAIQMGGVAKLTNPQAGLAFSLTGFDPAAGYQPPAPALASAWLAGELVENYWMALARDVNFDQYGAEPITQAAITEIAALSDWRGPVPSASTLFRGSAPGCNVGPYLSQFFYMKSAMGPNAIDPQIDVFTPNTDYMTAWPEYLNVQNGGNPSVPQTYVPAFKRYMINGRDIARWVHMDVLFQAYFCAALSLLEMGAPLKNTLPYQPSSATQKGFATFGVPHIQQSITEISVYALRAVWYQKWFVHRKLRPEEGGARVDRHKNGLAVYPLHADVVGSTAVANTFTKFGSYLLPQAFAEGAPTHPSYGAGHATVAGACSTLLKFWFDESFVLPNPVAPSADGSTVNPIGDVLTVGGEINKIAANVAYGRNIAGVHWRSDAVESLKLGEQLAMSFLRDQKALYNEVLAPWTATGFDGTLLVVA